MGSIDSTELGSEKKPNPGKATILAIGKAFPHQLVMQEYLVDGYFKTTNCDDPELKTEAHSSLQDNDGEDKVCCNVRGDTNKVSRTRH